MPNAARKGDDHACPSVEPGPTPHVGGPIQNGSPDVEIEFMPAARAGIDAALCQAGGPDKIAQGSATVFINNKHAARIGDMTEHAGVIVGCAGTVEIGVPGDAVTVLPIKKRTGEKKPKQSEEEKSKNSESGGDGSQSGGEGSGGNSGDGKGDGKGEGSNGKGKEADPTTCLVTGVKVSCGHGADRVAGESGCLQIVGATKRTSTTETSIDLGSTNWSLSIKREHAGSDEVVVRPQIGMHACPACGGNHSVALSHSPTTAGFQSRPDVNTGVAFPVAWSGPEPAWPTSEPQIWFAHAQGCTPQHGGVCKVEMYQPTQTSVTLTARSGEPKDDSELRRAFFGRAFNFFNVEWPSYPTADGSIELAWGYIEVPADPRVEFKLRSTGSIGFGAEMTGSANLVALAAAMATGPLVFVSRFIEYGIEVALFLRLALRFTVDATGHYSNYAGGGTGRGMAYHNNLTAEVTLGLKVKAGFDWLQSIRIEGGSSISFPGRFGLEFNDRGVFVDASLSRGPVELFLTTEHRGWFMESKSSESIKILEDTASIGWQSKKLGDWS